MKKLILAMTFALAMVFSSPAYADEFKGISIEANIDENGIGHINETRRIKEDETDYTERYKYIDNLRGIKIEDFSLMAFGKEFKKIDPWDTDLSFEEKSYSFGTIEDKDHIELCWGISKYEDNSYTLSYKINPLAIGLNDADMVFFKFVGDNFDPKPQRVRIKISAYKPLTDIKFWGFGLEGNIENKDGDIILESTGDVDYATVMVKFPKGTFATSYREDKTFDQYADKAAVGSDWEKREGTAYQEPMPFVVKIILMIGGALALIGGFWGIRAAKLHFDPKKISNSKDLKPVHKMKKHYYKDLAYDGYLEDLAFILEKILYVKSSVFEGLINAYLVKWSLDKKIDHGYETKGLFNEARIKILDRPENMGPIEEKIFDILYQAQINSKKEYLTSKALEKYFKKNDDLEELIDQIEDYSIEKLKNLGYLKTVDLEKSFLGTYKTGQELEITDDGINLYENLVGLKNYLENYGDLGSDDPEEREKWDDFLIYSALLEADEKFTENLSVYPYYTNYLFYYGALSNNSRNFSKSVSQTYGDSFSQAGFGGSTSFGGGGGSFGGGGGGGR